jgi:pimeloyl-ACP methyl ester carboxylesterase
MSEASIAAEPQFLSVGTGDTERPIAMQIRQPAKKATGIHFVWLSGYRSDMSGSKALALDAFAADHGHGCIRFDYSGHGLSGGKFTNGTISRWLDEALAVLDHVKPKRIVLVGSSMGGWIALLLALRQRERVAGLIGIAAAPDFTTRIEAALPPEARAAMAREGVWHRPSAYGDPYPITRALIEDGRRHLLLQAGVPLGIPVRLLQGQRDPDVPWEHALRIAEAIEGPDVQVVLVKDGDHRLSRPQDLRLLRRVLGAMLEGG